MTMNSDGRVSITDGGAEMKDLLSSVAEFYLSRNLTRGRKLSMPVPYFIREIFDKLRTNIHGSSLKLEANAVAPVKSPEENMLKQLSRKQRAEKCSLRAASLFSVICKVAHGSVPFCPSKLLRTGFGFGPVWLSWAVNRPRDTVIYIGDNAGKLSLNEDVMVKKVHKSVREIHFGAATLIGLNMARYFVFSIVL
ncbi:uncharacterized protein LOC115728278 [Rhodamnia argentea]|uniref:Uncharacterized protein LOC115728278 n=1 Tax=Rhodamnia argentea TaxID=178133 RepID=A0ABM3HPT4_9MYRT|nr:uncharacterized protein LOC115728278 [Rhodamnia argentea]